ncbi:MAG: DUF445 family protein [Treponema sp.]|jgi:uncharacterized membrane protein YheB (UPF0754 family)|nr:DUF445 family protein [Treponema sp.]
MYVPPEFIIAPLGGAVIGYVTNAIAVKMLFRPLKEIRVAGLRLPFTPGVLPRHRRRLADSIGAMVERELFTPRALAERLADREVREKLSRVLLSMAGKKAEAWYPEAVSRLVIFLSTPKIRGILESQGRVFLNRVVLSLNVFQRLVVAVGKYDAALDEKMPAIIEELLREFEHLLRSETVKEKLLSFCGQSLEKAVTGELSAAQLAGILDSVNVRALVRERIDKLDMLRVEGIILDLMAGELKWINLFGAVLGALIGVFQILISVLFR